MPEGGVGAGNLTGGWRQGRVRQPLSAELDARGTEAIAQKAEVPDADEPFGQDV